MLLRFFFAFRRFIFNRRAGGDVYHVLVVRQGFPSPVQKLDRNHALALWRDPGDLAHLPAGQLPLDTPFIAAAEFRQIGNQ